MPRTPVILPGHEPRPPEDPLPVPGLVEALETEALALGGPGVPAEPMDDLAPVEHLESPPERPKYDRAMRNETPERLSDILVDQETGRKYQTWGVGMVRNAVDKTPMRVWLEPIPHIVLDQHVPLRGWYENKFQASSKQRPRPCETDALLTSPYGGYCAVGCAFCYINNGIRGYRGQGVTVVDPTYPDKTAKQLARMRTGAAVYMSSFIDPFLEVEDIYHNTERTARAADAVGLPMFFLTRKQPPGWAFDLLRRNTYSYMQFSINTSNRADWRKLSPQAVTLDQTIDNVREMHRHGIYVSIQVNPIVAGVTSTEDIVQLIHELAAAGADHLIFKYVEIVWGSASGMLRQIRARFPDRADAFEALFTQNIGNFRTIHEDYRRAGLDRFKQECVKAGTTMATCYEYSDLNRTNKTGVSIGPEYLTADQCHGHRVPVFSRATTDVPFHPIEECPASGCLHCADHYGSEQAVPCGNELLARAPAWDPVMLNEPADVRDGANPTKLLKRLKVLGSIAAPGGCATP